MAQRRSKTSASQWLYLQTRRKVRSTIYRRLYRDKNRDIQMSMIVAGVGRSGTTWLADIITSQLPCRVIWEPFNAHTVREFGQFDDFLYKCPTDPDPRLFAYASKVLRGEIRNRWVDREISRLSFEYRIVKEIRANLFLNWLHVRFPNVPLLFIVRHPCAVVLSRMEANWSAHKDLEAILSQTKLVESILSDKMDIIRRAESVPAKHAVLWAIQHLVPIRQFRAEQLSVVFYENLCLHPEVEIPRIFQVIGHGYRNSVFTNVETPSRTIMRTSAIRTGENKVMRWKKHLSQSQIRDILSVVGDFGLDHIYGDSSRPLVEELTVG